MRHRVGLIVVAATATLSCTEARLTSPTAVTPPATTVMRAFGTIVDYTTHQGVANVTMTWAGRTAAGQQLPGIRVVSDGAGKFATELPIADQFFVTLSANNASSAVVRVSAKRIETDFLVQGQPCAARYGYVFDVDTHAPIAGATVARAGTATTDATGYYQIDIGCVPRDAFYWGFGTTIVSASHPDYVGSAELDGRREGTSYSGIRRVDFALKHR